MAKIGRPARGADFPTVVATRLAPSTAAALKATADAHGVTVAQFVRDLVAAAVAAADEHRELVAS